MALRADYDISLKDGNANAIDYETVRQIKVPTTDGGEILYSCLHSLYPYFAVPGDATDTYVIKKSAVLNAGAIGSKANACMAIFDDGAWSENIGWQLDSGTCRTMILFSTRQLTIGETYHIDDI